MIPQQLVIQRVTLFIFLIISVWYGYYIIQPPAPLDNKAGRSVFSAERAFEHVKKIAATDRPLGSEGNERARTYIFQQLQNIGLNPSYHEGIAKRNSGGMAGTVTNIMADVEGTDADRTILLMAHYDSVPNSPGAGDDASGVAAILEVLRAVLSSETPLKNNILILFTDGEELGLLGAELFAEEYSGLHEIDLVLNLEARGSSGPSIMFETGPQNYSLISHFAKAAQNPVANSLAYTVYELLPNDTDFSVTKRAGLQGLNFAFTDDFLNYHTSQDTPENLSPASLQHHGNNLLDNVLYFGSINFNLKSELNSVYFNNPTGGLSYYPEHWSLPLASITAFLILVWVTYLFRIRILSTGRFISAILIFVAILAVGSIICHYGWKLIEVLHPGYETLVRGETYNGHWYFWGFSLLTIGFVLTFYSLFEKKLQFNNLLAGIYAVWITAGCLTAWYLPTAAYLFTWPALFGLTGWLAAGLDIKNYNFEQDVIMIAGLFPALFIIPSYIYLIQVILTTELIAVAMILLILLTALSWPLLYRIFTPRTLTSGLIILLTGILCFAGAFFM